MVLSAQATDAGVNKATRKLYPVANTPAAILALGEDVREQRRVDDHDVVPGPTGVDDPARDGPFGRVGILDERRAGAGRRRASRGPCGA